MARQGILTDREREWVEYQLSDQEDQSRYTVDENRDLRYRVESRSASVENIRETALALSNDLVLVDEYFRYAKPQPAGKRQWDDNVRPLINDAMRKLSDTALWLSELPDKNVGDEVRAELQRALEPLSEDLTRFREFDRGKPDSEAYRAVQEENRETHGELLDELDELRQRREALNHLLGNREWYDLLAYISETKPVVQKAEDKLKENMIGARSWNLAASQTLRDTYGVIQNASWLYEPTDRGRAVLEAYHSIEDNKYINDFAGDSSAADAALYLLQGHFPANEWDYPEKR